MSGSARKRLGSAASAASAVASRVDSIATSGRRSYGGTAKDASHGAFYAGLAKGFAAGMDGLVLFAARPELRARLRESVGAAVNAQIAYVALAAAVFVLFQEPAGSASEALWAVARWGRILTLVVTLFLERRSGATEAMFFAALSAKDARFADAVRAAAPPKPGRRERLAKYKRIAKMAALRFAGMAVARVLPGGRFIAMPALRYISLRPTLGGPGAAAVAAVHALPESVLALGHADDVLVSVSDAIVDADDAGFDAVRTYVKRLDGEETREYFRERYRGYVTGMGALYSVLEAVPFLGVPIVLVAECGAACCVVDIVRRNLDKDNRRALTGEAALAPGGPAAAE